MQFSIKTVASLVKSQDNLKAVHLSLIYAIIYYSLFHTLIFTVEAQNEAHKGPILPYDLRIACNYNHSIVLMAS